MNNNDIEEDIKILENLKDKKFNFNSVLYITGTVVLNKKEQRAIENVIAGIKRLEKENENWEKCNLEKEDEITELNNKLFEAKAKANKYDSLAERIKEIRNSLEKDGFVGYADELMDILEEE